MYFTTLEINKLLKESTGIDANWPPDSHDLTFKKANQSIPITLYNFVSWCLGYTSEPVTNEKVKINPSDERKVVWIAQDLIYAESGKKADSQVTGSWIGSSAANRINEIADDSAWPRTTQHLHQLFQNTTQHWQSQAFKIRWMK